MSFINRQTLLDVGRGLLRCGQIVVLLATIFSPGSAASAMGRQLGAIVVVREEFGDIDYLRITPSGPSVLCRLSGARLKAWQSLDSQDEAARVPLKELSDELDRLAKTGWSPPTARAQAGRGGDLPVDGPLWRVYLISREAEAMVARDLSGYPRVGGLASLLHTFVRQRGVRQPAVSGVLVDWNPEGAAITNAVPTWRTQDAVAMQFLASCGTLLPEPVPAAMVVPVDEMGSGVLEIAGERFLIHRVRH